MSQEFKLSSTFSPTGDQPQAIERLSEGVLQNARHQTLVGVTGSGKSLTKETPVLIKRGVEVALESIGGLIDQLFDSFPEKKRNAGGTEIIDARDLDRGHRYEAYSFDPVTKRTGWKPIVQFVRHRSPARLYTVRTRCGRQVTVTGDHNFFVLRRGVLCLKKTGALTTADYVPVPLRLDEPPEPLTALELTECFPEQRKLYVAMPRFANVWTTQESSLRPLLTPAKIHNLLQNDERSSFKLYQRLAAVTPDLRHGATVGVYGRDYQAPLRQPLTDGFCRFIGYYIAEGHAADKYFIISSADPEIVADFTNTLHQLGLKWTKRPHTYDYQISSKFWQELLAHICGRNAQTKRLPKFWPQLSNVRLANILRAYFSTDGGVDGSEVTCVTASTQLASDLAYALLRFGIVARMRKRRMKLPTSNERREYWTVRISGQKFLRAFKEHIGFVIAKKQRGLDLLARKPYNTNVDVIPIDGAWLKKIRTELTLRQRDIAHAAGVSRSLISLIEHGRRLPSREMFERLLGKLREYAATRRQANIVEKVEVCASLLQLFWTPIQTIEKISASEYVYDLAVQDNETFFAGTGGVFVHNTFTMANVIACVQKPALVIAHNKTLAAQLYQEFREFFPENAVHYFVSYYDYYQPEAYIPQTDTYIEKDAKINEEIDRLRHAATADVLTRPDVIVVASVSCIYGIGDPAEYEKASIELAAGSRVKLREVLKRLALLQYERNDLDPLPGQYRVAGDTLEVYPPQGTTMFTLEWFGDALEAIRRAPIEIEKRAGPISLPSVRLFPAKHFVTPQDKLTRAIANIREELRARLREFKAAGKLLEAERLEQRTTYDLEMLEQTGYCSGVENYSRQLSFRNAGDPPSTLLDYLRLSPFAKPNGYLTFIDESHMTIPQVRGMAAGDRSRKQVLVNHGFRLPSAIDNRPLEFPEFEAKTNQVIYVSATPAAYELAASTGHVAEQLVRPTGLLDPVVEVRPAKNQVADTVAEIKKRIEKKQRVLVTTLTKRLAEEIADHLTEQGIKAQYLHSDLHTLVRPEILRDLRKGEYDVLVGINLLREGLDLPEVSLVAILDADKEGFLRNATTLIQTMGRAARHVEGAAILYGDRITNSIKIAIEETKRRRKVQEAYNVEHGITPKSIEKEIRELVVAEKRAAAKEAAADRVIDRAFALVRSHPDTGKNLPKAFRQLKAALAEAVRHWRFEEAARLRDAILDLADAPIRMARDRRR